jgi:DNA invertase Pin-like site-specific DNA recombinase
MWKKWLPSIERAYVDLSSNLDKILYKEGEPMIFGYARVSTKDQSLEVQIEKLKHYGCEEIYTEMVSGAKDNRPELNRLLDKLRPGDTVVVVRLDRLGRRMMKLVELMTFFKEKGIGFVALDNSLDTTTPFGMLLFNICAAFAEMERELIRERVKAGLDNARSKGRKGGRIHTLTPDKFKKLIRLRATQQFSVRQMCEMVGITRSVYYRAFASESSTNTKAA